MVTINTNPTNNSYLTLTGLQTTTGDLLCIDDTLNTVSKCSAAATSLQSAYNGGNTITTTNARDIAFNLADTTTDSNFAITTANGSTGSTVLSLAGGASTTTPSQLLLVDNASTNTLPAGIKVTSSGTGPITYGLDLSDANITNALNIGGNAISGTNFSVSRAGDVTVAGDLVVNGGDVSATSGTSVNLFNTTQTTSLAIGGSATTVGIGGTSGTITLNENTNIAAN